MNLHLNIPPTLAHPSGCIKGTIFGLVRRYYAQNTYHRDFVHFVQLLYYHLLHRGWQREVIRPMILDACTVVQRKKSVTVPIAPPKTATTDEENLLSLHFVCHPDDISPVTTFENFMTNILALYSKKS